MEKVFTDHQFDEIVVVTLPRFISRWLKADLSPSGRAPVRAACQDDHYETLTGPEQLLVPHADEFPGACERGVIGRLAASQLRRPSGGHENVGTGRLRYWLTMSSCGAVLAVLLVLGKPSAWPKMGKPGRPVPARDHVDVLAEGSECSRRRAKFERR